MADVRGTAKVTSNTSVGQIDIGIPALSEIDDVAVLVHAYNPTTQDSVITGAGGTGWTLLATQSYSGSFRIQVYKKKLAAAGAATVSFTNTTVQRMAASMVVLSDCTDTDVFAVLNETISQAVHTAATTGNLTAAGVAVGFVCERSSAPSSSVVSVPAGFTAQSGATGFATGNGSCSIAAATKMTDTAAGSPVGGGQWELSNANGGVIAVTVAVSSEAQATAVGKTLTTSWNDRTTVGGGFTGNVSHFFKVAGLSTAWQVEEDSVVAKELTTSWNIGAFVSVGFTTSWNLEELPEDPGPEPDPDPDPSEPSKRVKFPTYKVPVGKGTLFSRFLIEQPKSLVKSNGEWFAITSPAQELLEAAEAYFIGGYSALLTEQEVADLGLPPEFVEDIDEP